MPFGAQGGQGFKPGGGGAGKPARVAPPNAPKGAVWAGPSKPAGMRGIGGGWWAPKSGGGGGGGGGNKGGQNKGATASKGGGKAKGGGGGGSAAPTYSPAIQAAAHALANAQTTGPITQDQTQIAANDAQNKAALAQTGGYFNQLGQQAQQGVTQTQGIGSALNAQLAQIGQQTQAQLAALGPQAQQQLLQYAPQSDQSNSLAAPAMASLASEIARQQGLAAQNQGAFQNYGATQGANYSSAAASNLGTFGLKGQETLGNIAQAGQVKDQPLNTGIAGLRATQGADYATALRTLSQQDVANALAGGALNVKAATATATAKNNAARTKIAGQQANTARSRANTANLLAKYNSNPNAVGSPAWSRRQAANAKNAAADPNLVGSPAWARAHPNQSHNTAGRATGGLPKRTPTGQPTLTPYEQQKSFSEIGTLQSVIGTMQKPLSSAAATALGPGYKAGQVLSEAQIRGLLASGGATHTKYDPALIDTAYALKGWGYVTQKQITELNKLGLIVGNRYRRGGGKGGGTAPQVGPAAPGAPSASSVAAAGF